MCLMLGMIGFCFLAAVFLYSFLCISNFHTGHRIFALRLWFLKHVCTFLHCSVYIFRWKISNMFESIRFQFIQFEFKKKSIPLDFSISNIKWVLSHLIWNCVPVVRKWKWILWLIVKITVVNQQIRYARVLAHTILCDNISFLLLLLLLRSATLKKMKFQLKWYFLCIWNTLICCK